MRRLFLPFILFILLLSGCSGWTVQPLPYIPATPCPSSTPAIFSPTPLILPPPFTSTSTPIPSTASYTPTIETPGTPTVTPAAAASPYHVIEISLLSCSTGLDVLHGMGEVINAYVEIKNTGTQNLTNVCATLNALYEGRAHPDKTKCIASFPAGDQVTLKLTVDTTVGKDTPIQVNVTSESVELQRIGEDACTDVGLPGAETEELTPVPITP